MQSTPTTITTDEDTTHRATIDAVARLASPARTRIAVSIKSAAGTAQARTYKAALVAVLSRIAALPGASLVDALCNAKTVASMGADDRRCMATTLTAADFDDLDVTEARAALVDAQRREIQRRLAKVGRPANAKGSGNPTRALQLVIELPGLWQAEHAIAFVCQPHEKTTFGRVRDAKANATSIERRTEPSGQVALFGGQVSIFDREGVA